ncbi:hypothetical protein PV08_11166 [Exophiala spinifera]|uniref:Uncharacterized protein n=1 Tax=Exophiala spinifera TaxID=91928 RepID=A0A0D2AUM6_9EURO|nr:uncharacterized protein PV08_11166 [Exophiala spinifera]KIW10205.1 hypothetical protein PV08_11166 [Exophiala spinifera]
MAEKIRMHGGGQLTTPEEHQWFSWKLAQRDAQLAKVQSFQGSDIQTGIWHDTKIQLWIHFDTDDTEGDLGTVLCPGLVIRISNDDFFSAANALEHLKSPHTREHGDWGATIYRPPETGEPAMAILEHAIPHSDFDQWNGRTHFKCTINLPTEDVTSTAAESVTRRLENDFDAAAQKELEHVLGAKSSTTVNPTTFPIRSILLGDDNNERHRLLAKEVDLGPEFQRLTTAQRDAIKKVYDFLVSKGLLAQEKQKLSPPFIANDIVRRLPGAFPGHDLTEDLVRIFSHPQSEVHQMPNSTPKDIEDFVLYDQCLKTAEKESWQALELDLTSRVFNGIQCLGTTGKATHTTDEENHTAQHDKLVTASLKRRRIWVMTSMASRLRLCRRTNLFRRNGL